MSDRIFAFPCTAPSPPETKTPPVQRPTASSFPNKFPAFCRAHPALLRRPPWCSGPVGAEANLRLLPCPLVRFTSETPTPLRNLYRTPSTLGADRLAAAVGAWSLCPGHPLLIIDAGSCITFDFVAADGAYIGGNIAPGVHARLKCIDDYFPRLPLVEAEGPTPELGYDTETAIRSGVIEGMRHEIQGYIGHLKGKYADLLVFLTGGDELNFADTIKSGIFADQFLVPRGLNHILNHLHTPKMKQK